MKKFIERIGVETAFAGLFGSIAIIAVFFEMAIAGFDPASIAGGVKDIAGTIITVVMLIIAISVTVHSVPVTGKNPCKITFGDGFLLGCGTFFHGISSKC